MRLGMAFEQHIQQRYAGLFTEDDLTELPVTRPAFEAVDRSYPGSGKMRRRHEALRRGFGRLHKAR